MSSLKFFGISLFVFSLNFQAFAFDVGGLVSDDNGGYTDVGFDGIAGSGDLGISDADLGGGFGVSDNSGTGNSGFGDPGIGGGDGGSTGPYGMSSDDAREAGRELGWAVVDSTIQSDSRFSQEEKDHFKDAVRESQELTDRVDLFADLAGVGLASLDGARGLNSIAGLVSDALDAAAQFSGVLTAESKVDLSDNNVHPNSDKIVRNLVSTLKKSRLNGPMTNLGLKGIKIVVMEDIPGSFYMRGLDIIYLSKKDVDQYGVAVLFHELLHAGLHKARRSGTISSSLYKKISKLNIEKFGNLNGYVGTSLGKFSVGGYGFQEAFVIGWSYTKILNHADTISNLSQRKKALAYKDAILNNKLLVKTNKGNIRMIRTGSTTPSQVKKLFLNKFTNSQSNVRALISSAQQKIRAKLPKLCAAGAIKVISQTRCNNMSDAVYAKDVVNNVKACGTDMKWSPVIYGSCGPVLYYKGP